MENNDLAQPVSSWTPGPWLIRIEGTSTGRGPEVFAAGQHYDDGSEFVVADCGCSEATGGTDRWKRTEDADSIEGNARLIAAAPEMYAALEAYEALDNQLANCEECKDSPELASECCAACFPFADSARCKMRAALAKARGEATHP